MDRSCVLVEWQERNPTYLIPIKRSRLSCILKHTSSKACLTTGRPIKRFALNCVDSHRWALDTEPLVERPNTVEDIQTKALDLGL